MDLGEGRRRKVGIGRYTHVYAGVRIERGLNAISIDNYTCVPSEKFSNYAD